MSRGETWFDDAAGPLVRPYAVTRGRTRPELADLSMITLVVALQPMTPPLAALLDAEQVQILTVCRHPTSVAEVAAQIQLPLSVVKILIGDLIAAHLMIFRTSGAPSVDVIRAVIHGVRRL
jgi:hypothetical protein